MHRELSHIELSGRVLDLGGDKRSEYTRLFQGDFKIKSVNIAAAAQPDHIFDLERAFPLPDASADTVVCINILEHLYNHQHFLRECARVVRAGGLMVLAVPFVMQVHPSPRDYFRFTDEALSRMCADAGFHAISVRPVGRGPFTAAAQIAYNPLSKVPLLASLHAAVCAGADRLLHRLDRKGSFNAARYPLGYLVVARR